MLSCCCLLICCHVIAYRYTVMLLSTDMLSCCLLICCHVIAYRYTVMLLSTDMLSCCCLLICCHVIVYWYAVMSLSTDILSCYCLPICCHVIVYRCAVMTKTSIKQALVARQAQSCVKVEVAVLGSPSLTVLMVSVDVKRHWTERGSKLCERRRGRRLRPW